MDPRSDNNSGLGLPQPGNDMGPLPPIRTPQFHAPDTAAPHFAAAQPLIGADVPTISQPAATPPAQPPAIPTPTVAGPSAPPTQTTVAAPPVSAQPAAQPTPGLPQQAEVEAVGPVDDDDTAFDEEWVNRAREVVGKTHNDPFIQSHELSKVKAQYIKLRYNKDIKVSE